MCIRDSINAEYGRKVSAMRVALASLCFALVLEVIEAYKPTRPYPLPASCGHLSGWNSTALVQQTTLANTPVFFFRGPAPTTDAHLTFQDELLLQCMSDLALQANVSFPAQSELPLVPIVDLNLQYFKSANDLQDISTELDWFSNHSGRGYLVHWQTFGNHGVDPDSLPEANRTQLANSMPEWDCDAMADRTQRMHQMMTNVSSCPLCTSVPAPPAVVLYMHCMGGIDRTGQMLGGYAIRYLGMSFVEAMTWNNAIAQRRIEPYSYTSLKWFCYWLKVAESRTDLDCTTPNTPPFLHP
eukprot:TRINITY_DN18116_c0_g1_i2.p1 TRINITY_DN18116_c0_g1~~TRINITY_DN18116_c0_g1_i2.p1  ORF type:complete len:298 (+),score=40.83 TRINITY_DN18116_c0_g1_i2:150-1043(+)